jgi:hypothetical protein
MLKILVAPALIALASWVARRWGPSIGGWFVALPLTSGPTLWLLALDRRLHRASRVHRAAGGAVTPHPSVHRRAVRVDGSHADSGDDRSTLAAPA